MEEYAIHELGHALGLRHEWEHPKTDAACHVFKMAEGNKNPNAKFRQLSTSELAINGGQVGRKNKSYLTSSLTRYDRDSIMNYDRVCADVTGVRFGSRRGTGLDREALKEAYLYPYVAGSRRVPAGFERITPNHFELPARTYAVGVTENSCVNTCINTHWCRSLDYNVKTGRCNLVPVAKQDPGAPKSANRGSHATEYVYYGKKDPAKQEREWEKSREETMNSLFTKRPNSALRGHNHQTYEKFTAAKCANQCIAAVKWCHSFDFTKATGRCDLSRYTWDSPLGKASRRSSSAYDHYILKPAYYNTRTPPGPPQ